MEPPDSWDLLTASLAVCNLQAPAQAWRFVTHQQLIEDTPENQKLFFETTQFEVERGPVTGPSEACRIAGSLVSAGVVDATLNMPDPNGDTASQRLEQFG
jgi:hypothetical protein